MTLYESIVCLILGSIIIASFFAGQLIGMHAAINTGIDCDKFQFVDSSSSISGNNNNNDNTFISQKDEKYISSLVNKRVEEELNAMEEKENNNKLEFKPSPTLPIKKLSYVSKKDFLRYYDFGINETISKQKGTYNKSEYDNILMMHYKKDSGDKKTAVNTINSALYGTKDCDIMLVVGNKPREDKHCLAYFNNYDNYHIQRFMRVGKRGKIDSNAPLQHVGRGLQSSNMVDQFTPPETMHINTHWNHLKKYLNSIDNVLINVGKITKRIVTNDNNIIIMVCNYGQMPLLMNFVCSAKSNNFDISMVLVFATDKETYDIAKGLGLEVFYDESIFGNIPSRDSRAYGDHTFTMVMWAKVLCTHIISMLNHNFLFQDVDIIWYKHPLQYFNEKNTYLNDYDIFFQGDGSSQIRYSPYSANSGFYYAKNNDKTRYLFTSFVYAGDQLWTTHSHQQVLGQILAEHHSLFNLGVKILPKDDFPGGAQYHSKNGYMENLILSMNNNDKKVRQQEDNKPWMFHMSWTLNKDNKLKFMKQMGMWYLKNDKCENYDISSNDNNNNDIIQNCCSAKPSVSCYYKDKPSIIPCHEVPSLDNGNPSFWLKPLMRNKSQI